MEKFLHLPPETINPISGMTRAAELKVAQGFGGRLPFDVFEDLIRRGVVPNPCKTREKKFKPATRGQKGIIS